MRPLKARQCIWKEATLSNESGEPARRKTITLYSSAHVLSACRECEVLLGIAWNSRMSEVFSLVGVALRPDETEPARWILTNGSGHPVYVQHPSFTLPVVRVDEGCSIALVDGSRITGSPQEKWLNVSIS